MIHKKSDIDFITNISECNKKQIYATTLHSRPHLHLELNCSSHLSPPEGSVGQHLLQKLQEVCAVSG